MSPAIFKLASGAVQLQRNTRMLLQLQAKLPSLCHQGCTKHTPRGSHGRHEESVNYIFCLQTNTATLQSLLLTRTHFSQNFMTYTGISTSVLGHKYTGTHLTPRYRSMANTKLSINPCGEVLLNILRC